MIITLRAILTLAVAAISISPLPPCPGPTLVVLSIYGITNLVLLLERPSAFLRRLPEMMLFGFDLAVVMVLMLMAGETSSHFYVTFFLIILMAGLSRSARTTIVLACVSSAIYGIFVGISRPEGLLEAAFTTRVSLFFVVALFTGYLAEEANKERGAHHRYRRFYQSLFEQSGDGILVMGMDDVVQEANPRACRILGLDPRGKVLWDVLRLAGGGGLALGAGSATGASIFRLDLQRPDGKVAACEAVIRHLDLQGETCRLLLLHDVGTLREMQQRMGELEKGSVLGQLIASITHEINNPLAVILGYAELLESSGLAPEGREYATFIREAGQRCKRVVNAFLDQYRSRPFTPVPARLHEVLRDAARLMDFHLRYNLAAIDVDVEEGPEIFVDPGQIEQLLINLISNAVKSMQGRPERRLGLRLRWTDREAIIEVSDTGCGIPAENLPRLFIRGFTARADESGHGLGLALSQEIANRHGGRITVESDVGRGTTFSVHLPREGSGTAVRQGQGDRVPARTGVGSP
jgi:signal transduction histidine kinase